MNGSSGPPWNFQNSRRRRFRLAVVTCSTGVKENCLQPHSPLHTVDAQCLEIAPVTPLLSPACTEPLIFPISIGRNVNTEKPPSTGSFCRRKIDLVGFLPCNSDTLWHITSHSWLTQPICCSLSVWASELSCSTAEPGKRSVAPVFVVMSLTMCSLTGVFYKAALKWMWPKTVGWMPEVVPVVFIKCQYIFFYVSVTVPFCVIFNHIFLLAKFLSVINSSLKPLL